MELAVITLSILIAFWLENIREEMQEAKLRKESLKHIVQELKYNRNLIIDNLNTLKTFNEYIRARDFLRGESDIITESNYFEVDPIILDSLKRQYPGNSRIQDLGTVGRDPDIDFFLGRIRLGMWEVSKFSGALIGADPKTLALLSNIYSALNIEFGYTDQDYHSAMVSGYNEFADMNKIIDATTRLEQIYLMKESILDNYYEQVLTHLEQKINE